MKILLTAPQGEDSLGVISGYCERAMRDLKYEVKIFDFRQSPYLKSTAATSIKSKIKKCIPKFHRLAPVINTVKNKKINKNLFEFAADYKPDILLVLKGDSIFPETLKKIRNELNIITVNWFLDTVFSPYWKNLAEHISSFYDYFFMIDSKDVLKYTKINSAYVECLPLACDPDLHKRIELTKADIGKYQADICFVGTIVPIRERILEELLDFDLSIWGPSVNIWGDCLSEDSKLKKCHRYRSVYGQELVKVYNASKIVLSIHGLYGNRLFSVTPRLFEVSACGTFQLVNEQRQISDLYKIGEEIVCYRNIKELRDLIKFYLEHPDQREIIAKNGQERAYGNHTYVQRIEKMIKIIKGSG